MSVIQPVILKKVSGKWQNHWGGENIEQTCSSGEIKLKVRDDRMTAFLTTMASAGNTYEVLVNGISQGIFNRNTYYTFEPVLGGGHPDIYNNGYTTYDVTIRQIVGSITKFTISIPFNDTINYNGNYLCGVVLCAIDIVGCILVMSNQIVRLAYYIECIYFINGNIDSNAFGNLNNLIKIKGTPVNSATSFTGTFGSCTNLKELENFIFDKTKNTYSSTFSSNFNIDLKDIISGYYPNVTSMSGFIGANYILTSIDIDAPLLNNFAANTNCFSIKHIYLRNTNFKSVAVATTVIGLQNCTSMTEQAWLNFVGQLESLVGYTSHTIDLRNNLSYITVAVRAALAAKNWTVLF